MALANFTLPFGNGLATHNWAATLSPMQQVQRNSNTNNLLFGPAGHQEHDEVPTDFYKNNPYLGPHSQQQQQQQYQYNNNNNNNNRRKGGNTYLPPIQPTSPGVPLHQQQQNYDQRQKNQQFNGHGRNYQHSTGSQQQQPPPTRTYGESHYNRFPPTQPQQQPLGGSDGVQITRGHQQSYFTSSYNTQTHTAFSAGTADASQREVEGGGYGVANQPNNNDQVQEVETERPQINAPPPNIPASGSDATNAPGGVNADDPYPERPPGFTRVQAGQGSRTQVHAVLDYDADEDDEEYYDAEDNGFPGSKNGDKKTNANSNTNSGTDLFEKRFRAGCTIVLLSNCQ